MAPAKRGLYYGGKNMNTKDLNKMAKAATANARSAESWLIRSNVDPKETALIDLITAAYYAGRAAMASNIYDTESNNSLNLSEMANRVLDECVEQTVYFR